MAQSVDDRVNLVPAHVGRNILPCTPLFNKILRFAHRTPPKIAIRDVKANCERTHLELLSDVLSLRETVEKLLDGRTKEALRHGEEVYLAVWAPGGYQYTVATLAVLALGAAAVPLTPALPVEEAIYFIRKSHAVAVLTATSKAQDGQHLGDKIVELCNPDFKSISIEPSVFSPTLSKYDILSSTDHYLDENKAGIVIFTSGTTGPPKGSVMRRAFISDNAYAIVDHFGLTEDDVMLHVLPVHHATGLGINFFPFLIAGACIEFRTGGFDERWMWERWKEGALNPDRRLTFFSGVPTIYMRMRRHYLQVLSKLPEAELAQYIAGARQFRALLCGTSALPHPIDSFWTDLIQQKIVQRYGATEFGAVFKVRLGATDVPDGSVGERVGGIDLKLSEGDEGEVLVKSPYMFAKYLNDPEATARAHDPDGYFRTGDIARRVGNYYWIAGRASIDILKSGGYKISALDIERQILSLPYIAEVIVVGVADLEFGQRVGAIISLQEEELTEPYWQDHGNSEHRLTLEDLRRDLREKLANYKLPTLLRVVEGELPKTLTGKVLKKVLGPKFFPQNYEADPDVQVWRPSAKEAGIEVEPRPSPKEAKVEVEAKL